MESGGVPGFVHVSQDTYNNLTCLEDYQVTEGNGASRSSFLKDKNVTTYLLKSKYDPQDSLNLNLTTTYVKSLYYEK